MTLAGACLCSSLWSVWLWPEMQPLAGERRAQEGHLPGFGLSGDDLFGGLLGDGQAASSCSLPVAISSPLDLPCFAPRSLNVSRAVM